VLCLWTLKTRKNRPEPDRSVRAGRISERFTRVRRASAGLAHGRPTGDLRYPGVTRWGGRIRRASTGCAELRAIVTKRHSRGTADGRLLRSAASRVRRGWWPTSGHEHPSMRPQCGDWGETVGRGQGMFEGRVGAPPVTAIQTENGTSRSLRDLSEGKARSERPTARAIHRRFPTRRIQAREFATVRAVMARRKTRRRRARRLHEDKVHVV